MHVRKVIGAMVAVLLVGVLGSCSLLGGSGPDQDQRDAWVEAIAQSHADFASASASGPMQDGFTEYTYISVEVSTDSMTRDVVDGVIEAVGDVTEDSNRGHPVQVRFRSGDPDGQPGSAFIDLTDIADEDMVISSGTVLVFSAGGEP